MHRDQRGDHGVQDAFGNLRPGGIAHRVGVHVQADIAHQHQAASGDVQRAPMGAGVGAGPVGTGVRRGVEAVGVQPPCQGFAALLEGLDQRAHHQPEPVAVGGDLVVGIHRRDRVLAVLDGGDRGFQHHVGDAGGIVAADPMGAVDMQLDVQVVVAEQDHRQRGDVAAIADERRLMRQRGARAALQRHHQPPAGELVRHRVGVAAAEQRHRLVEEFSRPRDHQRGTQRVEFGPGGRVALRRDRVGAVQRIIQAAPARIGRVQRVAGVGHRHHELRPGDRGDLRIDVFGGDADRLRLGHQVANVAQECLIGGRVERLTAMRQVPGVDRRLQRVALVQQRPVAWRQVAHQRAEPRPEPGRIHARARDRRAGDEVVQHPGDLQPAGLDVIQSASLDVIHLLDVIHPPDLQEDCRGAA